MTTDEDVLSTGQNKLDVAGGHGKRQLYVYDVIFVSSILNIYTVFWWLLNDRQKDTTVVFKKIHVTADPGLLW